ncbi:MAG: dienelactone hydrolase family protein [Rhodocyclales bacterium]|nr:dienelactone hydrolase family protein [Rhodocyclales bacterium]
MNKLLVSVIAGVLLFGATLVAGQTQVSIPSLATEKPAVLNAYMYTPEGPGPFPAVVLAHGCDGTSIRDKNWAQFLLARGYVALIVDSFTTRSISSICTGQQRLSLADRAGDALGTLKYLQSLANVDKHRIGIMGFSHGAMTVLKTTSETTTFPLGVAPRFAAATALYPDCLTSEVDTTVPLLIQSGERDDWTAAAPCQLKTALRKSEGYPVDIKVYEGALHAFDKPDVQYYYGAQFLNSNKPKFCCGATVGYSHAAHQKAEQATEEFFFRHLKAANPASQPVWASKPEPTRDEVSKLVLAAKAYAAANGKEKLIQLIDSQDAQFRKRRLYLVLLDSDDICIADGLLPVAGKGLDYAKFKDTQNRPYIDAIKSALEKSPPWGSLYRGLTAGDIYAERLDNGDVIVGTLIK